MREVTLRELCRECRVTRRVIQGYEEKGLIEISARTKAGYLLYDERTIKRVKAIRKMQRYGFTLREIRQMVNMEQAEIKKMFEKRAEEVGKEIEEKKEIYRMLLEEVEHM